MSEATPRITAQYLQQFENGPAVRILGKVTQLRGDQATIDAGGSINLHLDRNAHLTLNNAAEIIGKVNSDLSIKVMFSMDFGPNIDFNAANTVVEATHRHKEIFYDIDQ